MRSLRIDGKGASASITAVRDEVTGTLLGEFDSAEMINTYFSEIGAKLDLALPTVPDPKTIFPSGCPLHFSSDVTVSQFLKLGDAVDISKHSGCMFIPSRLYRDTMRALPEQFVHLYNLLIKTDKIPKDWKLPKGRFIEP